VLFYLVYYAGISFTEAYNFPIGLRTYMFEKLTQEINEKNKAMKKTTGGSYNPPK
jgi:hypothetical protein